MKPHPRIWRTTKWAGAVLSIVLVVVWAGSAWYDVAWFGKGGYLVSVESGRLAVGWPVAPGDVQPSSVWRVERSPPTLRWWYARSGSAFATWILLPIWPIALSTAIVTLGAWRLDTNARDRLRHSACVKCGYDRAGLAAASPCPECDAAAPPAPRARQRT